MGCDWTKRARGCREGAGLLGSEACEEGCSCIRLENSAAVRQATGDPDTTAGQAAAAHGGDVTQSCAGSGPWVACACDVCDAGSAMQEGARPPLTRRSPRLLPRNASPGVEQRTASHRAWSPSPVRCCRWSDDAVAASSKDGVTPRRRKAA